VRRRSDAAVTISQPETRVDHLEMRTGTGMHASNVRAGKPGCRADTINALGENARKDQSHEVVQRGAVLLDLHAQDRPLK
jgi:hypothetical protein